MRTVLRPDIRRTPLLAHSLPGAPDRVQAYRMDLPPGQAAGPHFHSGAVTGYVERGLIAFERDGQPMHELHPGDVFFEPAGETNDRFDNLSGSEPAVFIACYLLDGDQPLIQPVRQRVTAPINRTCIHTSSVVLYRGKHSYEDWRG
jgi:quercetin dioxygenase-like cupin family protein